MASWLKKILGKDNSSEDRVKSFEEETSELNIEEYRKAGTQSIPLDKIVGSVGRAHELNSDFRYRGRSATDRYHNIEDALRAGRPARPIKVFKVEHEDGEEEYYVVDGHHRVSQAKQHGYGEMNADITEIIVSEKEESSDNNGES